MTEDKLVAIISDIHGNSWALEKVLEDIKNRDIKTILNLGDSLYGPLDPKGTFELISNNNIISICGNQDRVILENLEYKSNSLTLEFVKSQLNSNITDWLISLPFDLNFGNAIYCCHASPACDSTYLLEEINSQQVGIKDNLEISLLVREINQKIIACGHSHIPRIVETSNKIIINPGSVGLPAYDDDYPAPHKMESFSSHAKYSIVANMHDLPSIDLVSIPYDWESAAISAEKNKRNDWASWIRKGRA